MVGTNRETMRHLVRISENDRRRPQNEVPPSPHPVDENENFPIIVVKAPSGGIASGESEDCTVQSVSNGATGDESWTESVTNIFTEDIAGDAIVVAAKENTTGEWIAIAEDCPAE